MLVNVELVQLELVMPKTWPATPALSSVSAAIQANDGDALVESRAWRQIANHEWTTSGSPATSFLTYTQTLASARRNWPINTPFAVNIDVLYDREI